jgi:epoxyqueuosine reductase
MIFEEVKHDSLPRRKDRRSMSKFDDNFREEMIKKLGVELLGAASVDSGSPILKERTCALLPGAKSVVVFGKEMYKEVVALLRPSKGVGEADPGELIGPHGDFLNGRLTRAVYELADLLRREGYRSLPLPAAGCPVDQRSLRAVFSYKHAAESAGLGTIGRHTLLITPQYGPRQRLACLLTEAPFEFSSGTREKNVCINCDACLRACPAQALKEPVPGQAYSMNPFACRTYRQTGLTCGVCLRACDEALESVVSKRDKS